MPKKRKKLKGRNPLCSICKNPKEETRSKQAYCRACHADYVRRTRPTYDQMTDEQKFKSRTRSYTRGLIRLGKLIPMPCEICGYKIAEAHHEDYTDPLNVRWLCRKHHKEHHMAKNVKHETVPNNTNGT